MQNGNGIASSPSSLNSLASATSNGVSSNISKNNIRGYRKSESRAYQNNKMDAVMTNIQFHARRNTRVVVALVAFLFIALILTSDAINNIGSSVGGLRGTTIKVDSKVHWGGAMRSGNFNINDAMITPPDAASNTNIYRFAAVTDLDQLSAVPDSKKPLFRSYFLPGILKRTGTKQYEITFEHPRTLTTKHNEAGRGAEFSELTIYNDRLLTFDDRTGDVFEIINNSDGTSSEVVPRFVITEGDGETDKGMKWEWATVKDGELYMGSMGKEYTRPDGSIENENNLWIGILDSRGQLRRENWKDNYNVVRKALGAESPGYIIMEAILWSEHMKKWVFLPRRISSDAYDEDKDEKMGGNKLVLVNEDFTKAEVVVINMEIDPLRGFSSFAFVPGTKDRHAIAIRSVEENCTGDLDVCQQRSYFLVFDVKTGEVLSQEKKYKENYKFEGIEFANMYAIPKE